MPNSDGITRYCSRFTVVTQATPAIYADSRDYPIQAARQWWRLAWWLVRAETRASGQLVGRIQALKRCSGPLLKSDRRPTAGVDDSTVRVSTAGKRVYAAILAGCLLFDGIVERPRRSSPFVCPGGGGRDKPGRLLMPETVALSVEPRNRGGSSWIGVVVSRDVDPVESDRLRFGHVVDRDPYCLLGAVGWAAVVGGRVQHRAQDQPEF